MSATAGDRSALWNSSSGGAWVRLQDALDTMYRPIEELLVEQVAAVAHEPASAIDVGCGTGATTLALARRLGADAAVLGVDVSEPMLDAARARVARAGLSVPFVAADAQSHDFGPGGPRVVASRFGLMFFDDPGAAFANLRAAASPGGALRAIVWRGPEQNPFMTAAPAAAADLLEVAPYRSGVPGPFGLDDDERTASMLREAGWRDVTVEPVDLECAFPESDLVPYLTQMGSVGRALATRDEATRAHVVDRVRPALEPFVRGDEVVFTAACWLVSASA
jgi:ubiquinone/menaquinone biosynthesis C-methylase UbiE